ncbi:MAG: hypothetical protein OEM90_18675, partial [Desulfobacteraceae bacterium]|nr:hypothetical protein [Desulfobacteraceae bacterium]
MFFILNEINIVIILFTFYSKLYNTLECNQSGLNQNERGENQWRSRKMPWKFLNCSINRIAGSAA